MRRNGVQLKTVEEIERLARGGTLLRSVLEDVARRAVPGATGRELDAFAEARLREAGAEPSFKGYGASSPFPASLCVSVNSAIVHGLPTDIPFAAGDVVGLDLGCQYEGLYTDTALTVVIGPGSAEAERIVRVTQTALEKGIAAVRPGATTGDIGHAIQTYVEGEGYGLVRDLTGHGVGYAVHEDPRIPNVGRPGSGITLMEGLVIAIEPMVLASKNYGVHVADDGWTVIADEPVLTAHEEHTVAVTKNGVRVLTRI